MAAAAPAAPPLSTEPQRVDITAHAKLLDYLAQHEDVLYADLPSGFTESKSLHRAWIEGLIQFGRREHVETGEKSENNARQGVAQIYERMENGETVLRDQQISGSATRYIIERGISWSRRGVQYKTLPSLLAEKLDFKHGSNVYEIDADGKHKKITEEDAYRLLGLRVRISQKALEILAS